MIFEGSEKKIEVIVDQSIGDLRKKKVMSFGA